MNKNTYLPVFNECKKRITALFANLPSIETISITEKSLGEYVSDFEVSIESELRNIIESFFPTDSIIGEELSPKICDEERVWYIDPIDGTNNFIRGRKEVAVSVGLACDGRPEAGLLVIPFSEVFVAVDLSSGDHTCCGFRPFASSIVSRNRPLIVGLPANGISELTDVISKPFPNVAFRMTGAVAFDLACMAMGTMDARFGGNFKDPDVVAGVAVLRYFDGKVTDENSKDWRVGSKKLLAIRNQNILKELHSVDLV